MLLRCVCAKGLRHQWSVLIAAFPRLGLQRRLCVFALPDHRVGFYHRGASIYVCVRTHAWRQLASTAGGRLPSRAARFGSWRIPTSEDGNHAGWVLRRGGGREAGYRDRLRERLLIISCSPPGLFRNIPKVLRATYIPSNVKALAYACVTKLLAAMDLNYRVSLGHFFFFWSLRVCSTIVIV